MNFKEVLKEAIKNDTKIIITGRSGYGKSEMVKQVAEELGYELVDFRLSEVLPEDLVGIPKVKDDYYEYVPPKWLYEIVTHPEKKYLLFLDEITQGTPEVLNICYKIFDKVTRVGNYTLENVAVVGATNYSDESNYLNELPEPLKKRACNLELDHSEGIYADYLMNKYSKFLTAYNKNEINNIGSLIRHAIGESNPRSVDKAISLMLNNCSDTLVTPYIGLQMTAVLRPFFTQQTTNTNNVALSNLEGARKALKQGFILIGSKRYDIEDPADLMATYNLTAEEYETIKQEFRTEFAGNIHGNNKGTIYEALNAIKPSISDTRLMEIINVSNTFNWDVYAKRIKLMAKDQASVDNQINVINVIAHNTSYSAKDIFKMKGEAIQYCAPGLLKAFEEDIDWDLYSKLYAKGRISEKNAQELWDKFSIYNRIK